jgi:hypothetical protein
VDLVERFHQQDTALESRVIFPRETCNVPRLRFADLTALEKLRRFAQDQQVGVIFAGATFSPDDQALLRELWPDLAERSHAYPQRKIKQLALVAPEGHYGAGGLVAQDGRLVTAPLEAIGRGLVFLATRKLASGLYDKVYPNQPSVSFVDGGQVEWRNRHGVHNETETLTYLTYSRGVLGLGANLPGTRFLVVDSLAFRSIGSFTPGQITPEQFAAARAQERLAILLQNVGRLLRGEEGKTAVLFLLNAEPELVQAIATSPAVAEGSELPPLVTTSKDLVQLVDQARRWLEAGGGDWPEPDAGKADPKKKGRKPKSRESVLAAVKAALAEGMQWREICQKFNLRRYISKEELEQIKRRSSDNCL